ncbi:integrase [Deltaproteobacteria bacterium Smac51]|nr:integrase [Deltaproteobacteria bacterium Smac51]
MGYKWIAACRGVRYREHDTRKHGKKPDRYWIIQYKRQGVVRNEGIGWWSEGASQAQAEEILAELRQHWRTGHGPQTLKEMRAVNTTIREEKALALARAEKDSISLNDFWEQTYYPFACSRKSTDTVKIEKWLFFAWLAQTVGPMPIRDIKAVDVERVLGKLQEADKSSRSQEHVKAILSGIISLAIRREIIPGPNPCRQVKVVKQDNQRVRFLSVEEATKLLGKLQSRSKQVHDEALLALFCGLRAKEIFHLTWGDIDFENRSLFIKDTKNKKLDRFAFMTSEVEEMLKQRRPVKPNPGSLVFPTADGRTQKSVSPTFREVLKELGWNDGVTDRRLKVVFHSLRHTFASWLVQDGEPLFTVSKLMGHSDIKMTMRYAHLAPNHLRQAAGRLEGRLNTNNGGDPA